MLKKITQMKGTFIMTDILDKFTTGKIQQIHFSNSTNGKVCRYVFLIHNDTEKYIMKSMHYLTTEQNEANQFRNEYSIGVIHSKECKYIAKPLEMKEKEDKASGFVYIEILFEYAGDSLTNYIGKLTPDLLLSIARKTLDPLAYLESKGVFHSDIKPANIVIKDDVIKIIDFGVSKDLIKKTKLFTDTQSISDKLLGVTPIYCGPEAFINMATYNLNKFDVYSWGMTMYQLLSGKSDDELNIELETYKKKPGNYNAFLQIVANTQINSHPNNLSVKMLNQVLLSVLSYNQEERPSFGTLKSILGRSIEEEQESTKKEIAEYQEKISIFFLKMK